MHREFKADNETSAQNAASQGAQDHQAFSSDTAETSIDEADDLYREIRIENRLMGEKGKEARLKQGAEVEVQIEAIRKPQEARHEIAKLPIL